MGKEKEGSVIEYYWELRHGIYGEELKSAWIPPKPLNHKGESPIDIVKRRWEAGEPINLRNETIPPKNIKSFEATDRPYSDQKMLDSASQVFKEPMEHERDSGMGYVETVLKAKWVKRIVTRNRYEKYFAAIAGYKFLREEGDMVVIAFRLPTHEIDQQGTPYCTPEECERLDKH